jgi:hypothetical protein
MLKLSANIAIGSYSMNYAASVNVESGWDKLTDTATIELPRRLKFKDKIIAAGENGLFQRGNPVNIQLGYDGRNKTVFQGYIRGIYPGIPVRFECEDELWQLKQNKIEKDLGGKSITLNELLQTVSPMPFQCVKAELGEFNPKGQTVAKALHDLKMPCFVREGKLYVGLTFWPELQQTHVFSFGNNIISSDLEFRHKEDISFSVEAVSLLPDNTQITEMVGDDEGERRTLHFYNLKSKEELKRRAEEELAKYKFTGYRGSFETFGEPFVRHGDKVLIKDSLFGHEEGHYLVKKVNTEWGTGGYRQKIELDRKL